MNAVSLNGAPVDEFRACTQTRSTLPMAVTLTATVELSTEDLVAALYRWESATPDELDNDDDARLFIAEAVLNGGLSELCDQRAALAECEPGTAQWDWLHYCRRRVAELFPEAPAQTRRPNSRRAAMAAATTQVRELVNA